MDCFVVTRKDGRKVWIVSRARKDGSRHRVRHCLPAQTGERSAAIHVVSS